MSAPAPDRTLLAKIDASMRAPALFFAFSAVGWLMIGTLFAIIASMKLGKPVFMTEESLGFLREWLTFGRARSAHLNAMAYGWANNAVFSVCLWIMARLCRAPMRKGWVLILAGVFWNIGVTVGVIGILSGDTTSVEWLEMPTYITPMLAVSYALIGVWGIVAFRYRQSGHVYVSQWYILAALFWLPWLYTVAQGMILFEPARGVVQALTNWWFAHNVLGLWLTPMGLATIYYLIPKVLGVPIHSYYLSLIGFWTLALFYNWAGVHHLIGGPIPAWFVAAGTVGSMMMIIPVLVTAINHHMTVVGRFGAVWRSPTLRFVVFGAMNYTIVSFIGSHMALPAVNEVTHFTHFTVGHAHQGVYAFFTMTMFGGFYYMMPRILRREWPSAALIRVHFWSAAVGMLIMLAALHIGGWIQGLQMNNPDIAFIETVKNTVPWLHARSVSGALLAVGHTAFAVNLVWMALLPAQPDKAGPTLFDNKAREVAGA